MGGTNAPERIPNDFTSLQLHHVSVSSPIDAIDQIRKYIVVVVPNSSRCGEDIPSDRDTRDLPDSARQTCMPMEPCGQPTQLSGCQATLGLRE